MGTRLQLQTLLESFVKEEFPEDSPEHAAAKAYFQPPANVDMKYPCIVYFEDYAKTEHADNGVYRFTPRYMVTVIHKDPDNKIKDKVARLPMCLLSRRYTADGLNHHVFNLYF
jgi:hypothetical protein